MNHLLYFIHSHKLKALLLFPVIVVAITIILSILGISGSSIGMYSHYFDQNLPDQSLLHGNPNPVRSDEWLVDSQMLLAQHEANYPYINTNIGEGQNMSLITDVPYKEWSILFKPQNWIFFAAPFDFSFAFKWWSVAAFLIIIVYLLVLELLPNRRGIAILLSLSFYLSPFIQWWLTPSIVLILGYSLTILLLLLKIHQKVHSRGMYIFYSALLAYILICFALRLYPPFQIPCALVLATIYISILLRHRREKPLLITPLLYVLSSSVVALGIIALFILTRLDAIRTILGTAYPGARVIESGGVSIVHIMSNFISPLLQQSQELISLYTDNQSESSNFAFPFIGIVLISLAVLFVHYKNTRKIKIEIALLLGLFALFVARMSIPLGSSFYKFILLGSVPNLRLFIGLGVISLLLLVFNIKYLLDSKNDFSLNMKWGLTLTSSLIYSGLLFSIIKRSPGFIPTTYLAIAMLAAYTSMTWLIVNKKFIIALITLLLFSILSVIYIHPLYRSVDILQKNPLSLEIRKHTAQDPSAKWIVSGSIQLENFAYINGAPSLSGVFILPQVNLFQQVNPSVNPSVYNRYAHVQFDIDEKYTTDTIDLIQADSFVIKASPCSSFLQKNHVHYIISTSDIKSRCVQQIYKFNTKKTDPSSLYIFKILE